MSKSSLRAVAIRSSKIEVASHVAGQGIRLASNLILSRLLFPEAFGIAALVSILIFGMAMLSDVGIEQSVVQSPRGDDIYFLNTAWLLHMLRSLAIWISACILSWPFAELYGEPQLIYLVPVSALSVVIGGFASTSLLTLRRNLESAKLMWIELGSQAIGVMFMCVWAYFDASVWALIVSGPVGALVKTAASHYIDVGYRNRFEWDRTAYSAIMNFGKWIFASTALSFVSSQSDRLMLGYWMGVATVGIYNIALFLSEAIGTAVNKVTAGVLYPILSQIQRESPERMREIYYRVRLRLDTLALIPMGILLVLSDFIVKLLYDARYYEAGWMMQFLCVRVAMAAVLGPMETCLFALGHTRYGFYRNVARAIWTLAGIPIGYWLCGIKGVVWVIALSELPVLLVLWVPFRRMGLIWPMREALAILLFSVGLLLGFGLEALLQFAKPYLSARLQ